MKYGIVYVVICDGEIVYASTDKSSAIAFANDESYAARQATLDEWDNDDPTPEDIAEADYQAAYDGDYYEVARLDISNKKEGDMVKHSGDEYDVSDILEKLEENE